MKVGCHMPCKPCSWRRDGDVKDKGYVRRLTQPSTSCKSFLFRDVFVSLLFRENPRFPCFSTGKEWGMCLQEMFEGV